MSGIRIAMTAALGIMLLVLAGQSGRLFAKDDPPTTQEFVFRLSPGDKLRISTFGEPSLSGDFEISPAGTIGFPLIGEVKAAGREAQDVQKDIADALNKNFVIEPKVTVSVANFRPFYILGEVNKPGEYPFITGLTVRGAVAKADGFTYRANEKRAYIKRAGEAEEKIYPLTAEITVQPGDIIRIKERYF
ncbi:polysaccharide export protein [Sphingobium sp. BYY-5]|uniref:polysaccharide biosynthesis/export family protein n=1 Tax=Sphingobium sp. BYY-5 TaxID=2926400 RepID=UPI001FA6E3F6|nr:polysaccharide biosynthesis/export family protein [Sphingobium sp. BYY-5]MCI4592668.1 polysaccharide export protein [Sphingobium sp. BYY-5]